jgi:BMFP domain-containing protein YqiC
MSYLYTPAQCVTVAHRFGARHSDVVEWHCQWPWVARCYPHICCSLDESISIRQEPRMSTTFDPRFLEDLAKKLAASVPAQLTALKEDLDNNFKSVLQAGLGKLDLVTRQEFDVQAGVLARTREMLVKLEARLAELERKP